MPLTPEQTQELQELRRLEELEQKFNSPQSDIGEQSAKFTLSAMGNKNPTEEDIQKQKADEDYAMQAGVGAGMAKPANMLAEKVSGGLGKFIGGLGDTLMQRSVGVTKAVPGFGKELAEQGLMGTKSGMAGQAARGVEASGQNISNLASQIPGEISQDTVANKIAELASKKMTPSGFARPEGEAAINKILGRAEDFAKAEPISGTEMAERRALAGREAREAGMYRERPSEQLKAKLAGAEQSGYSEALKNAYRGAFPEAPEALANADKSYSTLRQAQQTLDKPEAISGIKNSLSQFIPSSLIESIGGRTAIGAEKALKAIPSQTYTAGPKALKDLIGDKYNDNGSGR